MSDKIYAYKIDDVDSRETYSTIHRVNEAHKYSKGNGVKVGIIDSCFGLKQYPDLYTGGIDVSGSIVHLNDCTGHGYSMALALREIAPECQIYAINYLNNNNFNSRAEYIVRAIHWAQENSIEILTFSGASLNNAERLIVDKVVDSVVEKNIITTFIHYNYEKNIYPSGLFASGDEKSAPDIRILHYDYNTFDKNRYEKYIRMNGNVQSGNDVPYFSISSTSPVLAGFIAILKSIDNSLTLADFKRILKETSYSTSFSGYASFDININANSVADIGKAAKFVSENKPYNR